MESKSALKSKTFWFNMLIATIGMKVPQVHQWLVAYPEEALAVATIGNMIVRLFTTGGLRL